jgi:nitroreductase
MGEINTLLGIPDDIEVVSIVPFGYPAQAVGKGRKQRKPLEEIVHWERWENTGTQEPGIH